MGAIEHSEPVSLEDEAEKIEEATTETADEE